MSRLLGIVLLYVLMFLGWTGVGLFMFIAPARFANLLNENAGLIPQVEDGDWRKN